MQMLLVGFQCCPRKQYKTLRSKRRQIYAIIASPPVGDVPLYDLISVLYLKVYVI